MTTTAEAVRHAAEYLPQWLQSQITEHRLPGAQVAIRVDGELLFSHAVGTANEESGEALTTDHVFRVASHSKTVTATAVMQLVEAGKVRLDDAISTHVPAYAGTSMADVTLRELLGQRAGVLRDGIDSDFWQLGGPFPDVEALHALVPDHTRRYEPMEFWKYTNIGFAMLGEVVAAVTGTPWGEYVREHVFGELGLTSTVPDLDDSVASRMAGAHSRIVPSLGRRVLIDQVTTGDFASATGVCSTAEEITAFMSALKIGSEKLLKDRSKRYMQHVESIAMHDGEETGRYGLGMFHAKIGARRTVGHSGGWPGHITKTMLDPKDGLCISVLTNSVDGAADPILRGVFGLVDLAKKDKQDWQAEKDEATLRSFAGRYENLWGTTDLVVLGDRLVMVYPDAPNPLEAHDEVTVLSDTVLRTIDEDANGTNGEDMVVERDESGAVTNFRVTGVSSWPTEQYQEWLGEHLSTWR